MILAVGFNEYQLQVLRSTFFSLNPNGEGKIPQIGLVTAVNRSRGTLFPDGVDEFAVREITRNAQQAPDRGITFQEFSRSLYMIKAKDVDLVGDD